MSPALRSMTLATVRRLNAKAMATLIFSARKSVSGRALAAVEEYSVFAAIEHQKLKANVSTASPFSGPIDGSFRRDNACGSPRRPRARQLCIDMEDHSCTDATCGFIVRSTCHPNIGVVLQAHASDAQDTRNCRERANAPRKGIYAEPRKIA